MFIFLLLFAARVAQSDNDGLRAGRSGIESRWGHGRVELYLYPPSGLHRACKRINLLLLFTVIMITMHVKLAIKMYEAYSESKYRFAVKKNRLRFRTKSYCYQSLHSSNYFSTYSPPLLRHFS